jgi:hypothetical protein
LLVHERKGIVAVAYSISPVNIESSVKYWKSSQLNTIQTHLLFLYFVVGIRSELDI